jgi:uncharacterized phage protein (TIGR01671 family)
MGMSREIKFRAWIKRKNELIYLRGFRYSGNEKIKITFADEDKDDCTYTFLNKDVVLEQFTGLHDDSEDEKEVYENDIVLINYGTDKIKAIVKFERGTFILVSDEFTDGYILLFEVSESDRKYEWINGIVIGNIHERSEDNDE